MHLKINYVLYGKCKYIRLHICTGAGQDFWKGGSCVEMAVVRFADLISFFLNIPWK